MAAAAERERDDVSPYVPDPERRAYWARMKVLYERQLARGGIINPSDDERRRLVVISSSSSSSSSQPVRNDGGANECPAPRQPNAKNKQPAKAFKGPPPRRKFNKKS